MIPKTCYTCSVPGEAGKKELCVAHAWLQACLLCKEKGLPFLFRRNSLAETASMEPVCMFCT